MQLYFCANLDVPLRGRKLFISTQMKCETYVAMWTHEDSLGRVWVLVDFALALPLLLWRLTVQAGVKMIASASLRAFPDLHLPSLLLGRVLTLSGQPML